MFNKRADGFTLLEVLVALAVLAVVMVVLGQTVGTAIRAYEHLDLKTKAWEVASDKMVEMQVYARWPKIGTQKQHFHQHNEEWQLITKVSKGPFQGTRRIDIHVTRLEMADKGGSLYTLSGLIGKPATNNTSDKPASNNPVTNNGSGVSSAAGSQNQHNNYWTNP